jgi:hypothetical protein
MCMPHGLSAISVSLSFTRTFSLSCSVMQCGGDRQEIKVHKCVMANNIEENWDQDFLARLATDANFIKLVGMYITVEAWVCLVESACVRSVPTVVDSTL